MKRPVASSSVLWKWLLCWGNTTGNMCFVSVVCMPKLSAFLVFFSSTVEWSFPWKELITKATATAPSAVEAWGNQLVIEDTTSTIVICGEEKNTETVYLLVWADNGRCQNDLPCSDKLSECHSTWGMETSVQHIVLLVLPNICSWLLCMFLCVVVQSIFKK